VQQVESAAARLDWAHDRVLQVEIFNSGNVLNEFEVSRLARKAIFEKIAQWKTVRVALIESRPEYITASNLVPLRQTLAQAGGKRLEVGIGLESVSDHIREGVLRKGFGRPEFERSVSVLAALDIDLLAYVMLKPTVMGDEEAVAESVRTAQYVFDVAAGHGVRARVALQPTFVVAGTDLAAHYLDGSYYPPTMEMVCRTARGIAESGEVHVGLWDEGLQPIAVPTACSTCLPAFTSAIADFNCTQDPAFLRHDLQCCIHCLPKPPRMPGSPLH
jgi:radical SAM enzyme (TIGR01210 family)